MILRWLSSVLGFLLFSYSLNTAAAEPLTLHAYGGISSPSPGFAMGIEGTRSLSKRFKGGIGYARSYNQKGQDASFQTLHHFDSLWEYSWPFWDQYHFFYASGALGLAALAGEPKVDGSDKSGGWGASFGASAGLEFPVADLMGFRVGLLTRHSSIEGAVAHVAGVIGVRFSVEWLGL